MPTAILTTYFNHNSDKKKLELFYKFVSFIDKTANINDLYLCEISKDNGSQIKNINIHNHYVVYNNDNIWHKESAINYLLKALPVEYENIVVFDADVVLSDDKWLCKTEHYLESNIMVQPFEYVKYVGPSDNLVDNFYPGMVKHMNTNEYLDHGNPGVCVAYKRSYLDAVGGLFDGCLLGGGDTINILAFFFNSFMKYSILDRVCKDHRCELLDYLDRCRNFIKNTKSNVAYIEDCIAVHGFHGAIKNRQYDSRYEILKNSRLSDLTYKDNYGFYRINKNTNAGKLFSSLVNDFFTSRESWQKEQDTPIIFNTNKNGITNNIFWLSDNDYFTFSNIKKIRMYFSKEKNIKYLHMFVNSEKITENFNSSNCVIEIDNPKTFSINADYYIPKKIGEGEDVRKLSIYLTKIEIMPTGSESYTEYSIKDIF